MSTLVIRADANPKIGAGHMMRTMALGQAWQDKGGDVVFLTAGPVPEMEKRLLSEGMEVVPVREKPGSLEDAKQTSGLAQNRAAAWVVLDGYHFDFAYQRAVKDEGLSLFFIDDCGYAGRYCADVILNQNLNAQESLYAEKETDTRLLLGSHYALLRREFRKWRELRKETKPLVRRLLITLGGFDPENILLRLVKIVGQLEMTEAEVDVVVGMNYPGLRTIQKTVEDFDFSVHLREDVKDMAALMSMADMAISGGGSTCWELAFMQVPFLTLVLADNQKAIAAELARSGASRNLGGMDSFSEEECRNLLSDLWQDSAARSAMSRRGREIIDGQGANRVLKFLSSSENLSNLPPSPLDGRGKGEGR